MSRKNNKTTADFFNWGVVKVFAALDGITPEEEAAQLLSMEVRNEI